MATKNNMVRCIECEHGEYMQWFRNPIICQCHVLNERLVAETRRLCPTYVNRTKEAQITHYDKYES